VCQNEVQTVPVNICVRFQPVQYLIIILNKSLVFHKSASIMNKKRVLRRDKVIKCMRQL
jgi:hypothetical protein